METITKENFLMINSMVKELIFTRVALSILENGQMGYNLGKVHTNGQTGILTRGNFGQAKSTDRVNSFGMIKVTTSEGG